MGCNFGVLAADKSKKVNKMILISPEFGEYSSEEKKQIKYSENSDYFDLSESYCYNKGIKIQHQFQVKEGNVVDRNQGADNGIVRQILSLLPGGDCCGAGGCAMPACQDCAREMAESRRES